MELKSIRKTYTFKSVTKQNCIDWINAINERKHLSIKEKMGHAPIDDKVLKLNSLGDVLFLEKLKKERSNVELQSTTMSPFFNY